MVDQGNEDCKIISKDIFNNIFFKPWRFDLQGFFYLKSNIMLDFYQKIIARLFEQKKIPENSGTSVFTVISLVFYN